MSNIFAFGKVIWQLVEGTMDNCFGRVVDASDLHEKEKIRQQIICSMKNFKKNVYVSDEYKD